MKKIIDIEGMSCQHCVNRVKNALQSIDGVKAKVSLKKKQAVIKSDQVIEDELIKETIEKAGYKAVNL